MVIISYPAAKLHVHFILSQNIARQLQCTPFKSGPPYLHSLFSILSTTLSSSLYLPHIPTQFSYGILF